MAKLDMADFQSAIDVEIPLEGDVLYNAVMSTETQQKRLPAAELSLDSPAQVYKEYAKLVQSGNELLTAAKYLINTGEPDGEAITAVASVITSVKETLKEFSNLHTSELRHQRQMELENLRHENRLKLLEKKRELENPVIDVESNKQTFEYSQEEIIKFLNSGK